MNKCEVIRLLISVSCFTLSLFNNEYITVHQLFLFYSIFSRKKSLRISLKIPPKIKSFFLQYKRNVLSFYNNKFCFKLLYAHLAAS